MARTTFFSFSIILVLQAVLSGLSVACYPNCPIPPGTIKLPLPDRELIKGSLAVFHVQDGRTRFVGCIDNDGMVAHVYSKSNPCRSAATHAICRSQHQHLPEIKRGGGGQQTETLTHLIDSPSDRSRFDQYRPLLLTYGSSQKFCGIKNNKFSCHSDMEEQGGLKDKYRNVDRLAV